MFRNSKVFHALLLQTTRNSEVFVVVLNQKLVEALDKYSKQTKTHIIKFYKHKHFQKNEQKHVKQKQ